MIFSSPYEQGKTLMLGTSMKHETSKLALKDICSTKIRKQNLKWNVLPWMSAHLKLGTPQFPVLWCVHLENCKWLPKLPPVPEIQMETLQCKTDDHESMIT